MAERPQQVGGLARRAVGDAGFAQMPVGGSKPLLDVGRRHRGKGIEETGPGGAGRPVLADIFVRDSGQPGIVAGPLRHPALARTCPAFLIAALTTSLAGLSRHSNFPPSPLIKSDSRSSFHAFDAFSRALPRISPGGFHCPKTPKKSSSRSLQERRPQ